MFKLHHLKVLTMAVLTATLAGWTGTAQAQVTIILKKNPYPTNPYPYPASPYPQGGSGLYIPGSVSPVAPVFPVTSSTQPAILPVAVPRPSVNGTIVNSTLINPTVINSTIVDSTLVNPTIVNSSVVGYPTVGYPTVGYPVIGYPTVVNTLPGTTQVVSNGLVPDAIAILQANNLAAGYRYYTQSNGSGNSLYLQVDSQPWIALPGSSKMQILQKIGNLYAGPGFSLIIESRNQQTLGKYLCHNADFCQSIVVY